MILGLSCMVCEVLGLGSTVQGPGFSSKIQCEGSRASEPITGCLVKFLIDEHLPAILGACTSPGWGLRKVNVDL